MQTVEEVEEEIERLLCLKINRKIVQNRGHDLTEHAKDLINTKLGENADLINLMESDRKEALLNDRPIDCNHFDDIMEIKREAGLTDEMVIII